MFNKSYDKQHKTKFFFHLGRSKKLEKKKVVKRDLSSLIKPHTL